MNSAGCIYLSMQTYIHIYEIIKKRRLSNFEGRIWQELEEEDFEGAGRKKGRGNVVTLFFI